MGAKSFEDFLSDLQGFPASLQLTFLAFPADLGTKSEPGLVPRKVPGGPELGFGKLDLGGGGEPLQSPGRCVAALARAAALGSIGSKKGNRRIEALHTWGRATRGPFYPFSPGGFPLRPAEFRRWSFEPKRLGRVIGGCNRCPKVKEGLCFSFGGRGAFELPLMGGSRSSFGGVLGSLFWVSPPPPFFFFREVTVDLPCYVHDLRGCGRVRRDLWSSIDELKSALAPTLPFRREVHLCIPSACRASEAVGQNQWCHFG